MMKFFRCFMVLLLVAGLAACSSTPAPERPYAEVEDEDTPRNPAVVTLEQEAARQLAAGNDGLAANALERAIRISPRDPGLRVELAEVRLRQGDPVQAKALARMAVAFGRRQPAVQADAWEVIGRAESRLGNRTEADLAFDEARRVRDGL